MSKDKPDPGKFDFKEEKRTQADTFEKKQQDKQETMDVQPTPNKPKDKK